MSPRPHPGPLLLGLAALALACAGPRAAPPAPGAPAEGRAFAATPGRYGPEPPASPSSLERSALEAVLARLERDGDPARPSAALLLAGRELALRAAAGEPDPLARPHLRAALARALAFDPAPTVHLVEARPEEAVALLASRLSPGERYSHAGVGAVVRGGRAYLVLLLVRRQAALRPFPREVAVGGAATIAGELVGLAHPSLYLTAPSGVSRALATAEARAGAFAARVAFDVAGRWLVEVVGDGPGGPEVAALVAVSCGGARLDEPRGAREADEPADAAGAEARVVLALNATRQAQGLPALEVSPQVAAVARRHSQAMAARGVLAHVLPGSGKVGERLREARVPYALVRENVAMGASALEAHHAAEESPAHRQNILSPDVSELGCGVARGQLPSGEPAVYLTEIFLAPVEDGSSDRMTPEGRVKEALWHERERGGAPALLSDPALDALARDTAREMLRAGGPPEDSVLAARALGLGRKLAAADLFVAARPADAVRSRNLPDRRFRRAGVGVAVGDSRRYGAGRLFIAVVYTD